jgi:hypothetical protein
MVRRFHEAETAMKRKKIELIREDRYAAEVPVEWIEEEGGWSPYLSLDTRGSSKPSGWPYVTAI